MLIEVTLKKSEVKDKILELAFHGIKPYSVLFIENILSESEHCVIFEPRDPEDCETIESVFQGYKLKTIK